MLPVFEIETGGAVRGRIEKRFTFFKPKYEVDFNGWRAEGDFLGWDYDFFTESQFITLYLIHPLTVRKNSSTGRIKVT